MDFSVGIDHVGVAALQELWNKVASQAISLVSETKDVILHKDSFQEFSSCIFRLGTLLQVLDTKKIEAAMGSEAAKAVLVSLSSQLREAHKIIEDHKSGSSIVLLLRGHSILSQMKDLANEIATTVSSFSLVNLDISLHFKSRAETVVNSLRSMEFQSAAGTESIALEIQSSISQNSMNRDKAWKLLEKIAEAVGTHANASLVQNELAVIKKEKGKLEDQKKHGEALQLAQLIQLLYSTEVATGPNVEGVASYNQQYAISSFVCPLCHEMMIDPVALLCGHSFERKAIQDHFDRGEKNCPTCGERLPRLELTPNVNLRRSISELRRKDMDLRFQASASGISCNDMSVQNKALDDLQIMMEMPEYAVRFCEQGLVPKLVEILKDNRQNKTATLKCLYLLARHCENHMLKEVMVGTGVVRHIVKQMSRGEKRADAIAVIMELSKRESLRQSIGKTKDCILLLVSLLQHENPEMKQKAWNTLGNLSSNTYFTIKMAEAGHFQPFVARFNQGPVETKASMAADLTNMQLKETSIKYLKDEKFIQNLIKMLSSNSPEYKLAGLRCIKKLIVYPKIVQELLSGAGTVPLLLGIILDVSSDTHMKQEGGEILALLVGGCHNSQIQMHQGLLELQSDQNVNIFLRLADSSDLNTKIRFLHLLLQLSYKSETVRELVRSNTIAVSQLFSSLDGKDPDVKKLAMKLIYCVSDGHSDGVPLPPSPAKETAINTLVAILTSSLDTEERSIAAGIISQLSKEDIMIDEILQRSEALKAIREVICGIEQNHDGIIALPNVDTSLLENALAALLRFTEPSKPDLQRQVGDLELYPSLIRVLSRGSSLAKELTAKAIAHLSQSSSWSMHELPENSLPRLHILRLFPRMSWCCSATSENASLCSVHGAACSARHIFCLVKVDAVKPLIQILSETDSGVVEAALAALETLLTDHSRMSGATAVIVDSQGVMAILQVLEKGSISAKIKALNIFHKIMTHTQISQPLFQRSERILIQLLQENALKKVVALVLKQMKLIPDQSSYF